MKTITIPQRVTQIDIEAFKGCAALEEIAIPGGVTEIRFSAFHDCTSLKSVVIPEGVKKSAQQSAPIPGFFPPTAQERK